MECKHCQKTIADGSLFCNFCGQTQCDQGAEMHIHPHDAGVSRGSGSGVLRGQRRAKVANRAQMYQRKQYIFIGGIAVAVVAVIAAVMILL